MKPSQVGQLEIEIPVFFKNNLFEITLFSHNTDEKNESLRQSLSSLGAIGNIPHSSFEEKYYNLQETLAAVVEFK
jgi:hypothetical protein